MFLAKQEIKSVPFQMIHEKATLAANKVRYDLQELEVLHYEKAMKAKAEMYNCTVEEAEKISPFTPTEQSVVNETASKARITAAAGAIVDLDLKGKASWLMPQLAAYISTMQLPMVDGKVNIREFLKLNFAKDDWHKGLYNVLMCPTRGSILPAQTAPENRPYSALVPLILMPFKRFHSIPYSAWDTTQLSLVVDANLYEAMRYTTDKEFTKEEILLDRVKCLTTATGAKAGTVRNPASWHKLYATKGTVYEGMPWLAQVMASQIWVAHPTNRTDLMILDWKDWDTTPEPLVDVEVLPKPATKKARPVVEISNLPWDD